MMIGIASAIVLGFVLLILLAIKMRQKNPRDERSESLARLEEVLRSAQLTNNGFFQSLELVQKNLEVLLQRAEAAEQRLRSLMLQPGVEKKDQYTAAALLLGDGQDPERVASMLRLPLPQVEIVRELKQMSDRDRKAPPRKKRELQPEIEPQSKIAERPEKFAAQPISVVDVIRKAASEAARKENPFSQMRGINA
jgi:hypothetical protein